MTSAPENPDPLLAHVEKVAADISELLGHRIAPMNVNLSAADLYRLLPEHDKQIAARALTEEGDRQKARLGNAVADYDKGWNDAVRSIVADLWDRAADLGEQT